MGERPRAGGAFWQVGDETFFARYYAEPDHLSELSFNAVREGWRAKADGIAAEVRVNRPDFRSVLQARMEDDEQEVFAGDA